MADAPKISPFLWFDAQAEEAAEFYTSLFDDGRILQVSHYPEGSPGEAGAVMTVEFELAGARFTALNGGPSYSFTPAVSFVISCDSQEEVDRLWDALTEGGEEQPCGWLIDRYGVSWQVVPRRLMELLRDADPARAARVTEAMLGMVKLDVAQLEAAAG